MLHIAAADIHLEFQPVRIEFQRHEPNTNILREQTVKIMADVGDQEVAAAEEGYVHIGEMQVCVVDLGLAINEGESLFEVCDAHSGEMHWFQQALFDRRDEFKQSVRNAIGDDAMAFSGVMYVKMLHISPEFRGNKLGLAALYALMRYGCMGCATVMLQATPLLPANGALTPAETVRARAKLRKHYEQLGFCRIGRTDYMGVNLQYQLPEFPG